eukprot:14703671-Heterocapsa_arctica.AAC.1
MCPSGVGGRPPVEGAVGEGASPARERGSRRMAAGSAGCRGGSGMPVGDVEVAPAPELLGGKA